MRIRPGDFVPPAWMFVGVSFGPGRTLRRRIEAIAAGRTPRRGWSLLGLLLVLAVGCAALTDKSAPPSPHSKPSATTAPDDDAEQKPSPREVTQRRLAQPVAMNFDGQPFSDVIEYVRNKLDLQIAPNWRSLRTLDILPDTPVTLNVPGISAERGLRMVLDVVGGDDKPLDYWIDEHGVVVIASADDLSRRTVIRSYDIRDLLVVPPAFEEPDIDGEAPRRAAEPPQPQITREELTLQIKDLIRNTVAPDHWREAGGEVGSLNELNGTLIINTTEENHAAIEQLLKQIRAARSLQVSITGSFLLVDPALYEAKVQPLLVHREGDEVPRFLISDEQARELTRAVRNDRDSIALGAPRLTMFNGQQAYVTMGTESSYVNDYRRDEQTGELRPVNITRFEGLMLLAQGTVSADGRSVTVTAGPEWRKVTDVIERPDPDSPAGKPLIVEHPQLALASIRTTASVPGDKTLLLSWTTVEGNAMDRESKDRRKRHLVVLIDPVILDPANAKAERITPGVPQKAEMVP